MLQALQSPAHATYGLIPGQILFLILNILGLACFAYIAARRLRPLIRGERDFRFDRPLARLEKVLQFWLGQWKHPRYRFAGTVHILIFSGFIILATRAFSLLILGISENFALPDSAAGIGHFYEVIADYAATVVFLCMLVGAVRRIVFKPARYEVPARYGKSHKVDAIFLLGLIATLMFSEDEPPLFTGLSKEEVTGPKLLAELAEQTGGRAFTASDPNDLPSVAARIGIELRNQYVLAYSPKNQAKDGKYRKIEVKVTQPPGIPNLKVHWRLGYYAPSQ